MIEAYAALELVVLFAASALVSAGLLRLLHPLLVRYALARPTTRSSHHKPTPQGGGIAVIAAVIVPVAITVLLLHPFADRVQIALVFVSAVLLGVLGAIDDIKPMSVAPRLLLQAIAVAVMLAALPAALRIAPFMPWWLERALLFVAVLWFVNLVNFMDGIDWMTAAETVPVTGALTLFALLGALPGDAALVALALCGAMVGFAPFNRPVARVFLGDVGSLPIGLLLAWLLILLAGRGHIAAALLLPLYYLADATVTLLCRVATGKPVLKPHRGHFYQHAVDRKLGVMEVVSRVVLLNIGLAALAFVTLLTPSYLVHAAVLLVGCALVAGLLYRFAKA
ncbi:MAG TPA: glycosyl transferase [Candidatus Dormibacteraeota bacterium]|nr:glycosyl transferase [Candidatus Dormibacteraeota bacterium]